MRQFFFFNFKKMLFFPPKKLGKNKGAQNKHAPIIFFFSSDIKI